MSDFCIVSVRQLCFSAYFLGLWMCMVPSEACVFQVVVVVVGIGREVNL